MNQVKIGYTGKEVPHIIRALNYLMSRDLVGVLTFSQIHQAILKAFQAQNSLPQTGEVDGSTLQKLGENLILYGQNWVKEAASPSASPQAAPSNVTKLYIGIGASSQEFNELDGWNEAAGCREIQDLTVEFLRSMGVRVWSAPKFPGKTDAANKYARRRRAYLANVEKVDRYIELHTDAAGNPQGWTGSMGVYYSQAGRSMVDFLTTYTITKLGIPVKNEIQRNFDVLTMTTMPACIIEILNHQDPDDRALLKATPWRINYARASAEAISKL